MRTQIIVVEDAASLAREGARRVAACLRVAVAARGRAALALAGGNTPCDLYRALVATAGAPWPKVHLFWSDERCVPPDHPDSNYRMAKETLLDAVAVPAGQVHRIRGEDPPGTAAAAYDTLLRRQLGDPPRLDLVLLGMGADGHVASLFPGHASLEETARYAAPVAPQGIPLPRVTLTLPAINAATTVMIVVAGEAKTEAASSVLGKAASPLPAARVRPRDELVWLLDLAAAAGVAAGR